MAKCGCTGNASLVVQGAGITVTGTGSATRPFVVSRNTTTDSVFAQIKKDDSTTIRTTLLGAGTALDPLIVRSEVVLVAPNGNKFSLAVSNAGVLSVVPA